MEPHALVRDESAITPAVGIVLLTAITMMLAATAGAFALGLTEEVQPQAPQTAFSFEYDVNAGHTADALTIRHAGGDTIDAARLEVVVADAANTGGATHPRMRWVDLDTGSPSVVVAGSGVNVSRGSLGYGALSLEYAEVRLVWTDEDGPRSFVLAEWRGPGAE